MIHHVVPTLHKELGGVDVAVRALCVGLRGVGENFAVHTLCAPGEGMPGIDVREYARGPLLPPRLGWSPAMKAGVLKAVQGGDIVHNHSLWMMPNIYAGLAAIRKKAILVNAPHGTLTEWSRGRSSGRKQISLALGQRRALDATDCFYVSSEREVEQLRGLGYRQPVAVIPNGVELPADVAKPTGGNGFQALFLARLHPTKGVETLLRSWKVFHETHPDATLVIAGPDEGGYGKRMASLATDLGLRGVRFVGPVVGQEKSKLYESADVYVLPTRSENFGLTVAEALAHGTPVITTRGAPWSSLRERNCGWWIDGGVECLTAALQDAHARGAEVRTEMGYRGRAWMADEFSWKSVASKTRELYRWLEGRGERPEAVYSQ